MANGRPGRPVKPADDDSRSVLTLRVTGRTKNMAARLATGYGMTVAEYVEALVLRDAGQDG